MDTCKINFCNLSGFIITNRRTRSDILKKIIKKHNIDLFNNIEKSYNDNLLAAFENKDIVSCFITRGKKYYLYLTQINNENITMLIDQTYTKDIPRIITLPMSIDDSLYSDTLFSGEMLLYNNNWSFLIESCKIYSGRCTNNMHILENIRICNDFVDTKIVNNDISPFDLQVKQFFTIDSIKQNLGDNKIPLIGIKFFGLRNPVVFYFSISNYKQTQDSVNLLDSHESNIEYYVKKIQEEYNNIYVAMLNKTDDKKPDDSVYLKEFTLKIDKAKNYGTYDILAFDYKNGYKKIGTSRVKTIETNEDLISIFRQKSSCVVRCIYNPDFEKWEINDTDVNGKVADLDEVMSHIDMFKHHKKAVYVD